MIYKYSWCLDKEGINEDEEEDNDDDEGNEKFERDAYAIVAPKTPRRVRKSPKPKNDGISANLKLLSAEVVAEERPGAMIPKRKGDFSSQYTETQRLCLESQDKHFVEEISLKRSAAEKALQLQTDELALKQNALKQSTKKEVILALIAQG